MKNSQHICLLLMSLLCLLPHVSAQDTVFISSTGAEVARSEAAYYHVYQIQKNLLLQSTHTFPENRLVSLTGFAGSKGKIKRKKLSKLSTILGMVYHPNGQVFTDFRLNDTKSADPDWKAYDENGDLIGKMVQNNSGIYPFDDSLAFEWYFPTGEPKVITRYKDGKWVSSTRWNEEGEITSKFYPGGPLTFPKDHQKLLEEIEEMGTAPVPLNIGLLSTMIGFPRIARDAGIEGQVVYRCLVNREGKMVDFMIIQSVHPILDFQIAGFLPLLEFTPAIGPEGDPILFYVDIPFNFRLM